MAQYIDKSPLVAEIESKIKKLRSNLEICKTENDRKTISLCIGCYNGILSILNNLEVKEVDLEKEIEEHVLGMPMSEFTHESEVEGFWDWAREEFRHFFELGIKAQKGE